MAASWKTRSLVAVALLLWCDSQLASAAVPADLVDALPGWNQPLPSVHYSGFLEPTQAADDNSHDVAGTATTASRPRVHYWLVESESTTPQEDPLVVWFNGGPPCSALLGFFAENGPFLARPASTTPLHNDDDQTHNPTGVNIILNEGRWNKHANLLYLESPLGVGFSYDANEHAPGSNETASLSLIHI